MVDRSGIVGEDGETHMGIYDTSYLRSIPRLTVIAPKGAKELEDAMDYAMTADGPVVIKYPKGAAYTEMDDKSFQFIEGKSEVINFSSQVGEVRSHTLAIFAVGSMVQTAAAVRDRLKENYGYEPELINVRFITPLDTDRIRETIQNFDFVAVIEESVQRGSIGEAVAYEMATMLSCTGPSRGSDSTSQARCCRLLHYCVKSETLQHGSVKRLREEQGLDEDSIYTDLVKKITN